jgi:hypothetical protein
MIAYQVTLRRRGVVMPVVLRAYDALTALQVAVLLNQGWVAAGVQPLGMVSA